VGQRVLSRRSAVGARALSISLRPTAKVAGVTLLVHATVGCIIIVASSTMLLVPALVRAWCSRVVRAAAAAVARVSSRHVAASPRLGAIRPNGVHIAPMRPMRHAHVWMWLVHEIATHLLVHGVASVLRRGVTCRRRIAHVATVAIVLLLLRMLAMGSLADRVRGLGRQWGGSSGCLVTGRHPGSPGVDSRGQHRGIAWGGCPGGCRRRCGRLGHRGRTRRGRSTSCSCSCRSRRGAAAGRRARSDGTPISVRRHEMLGVDR
jgi:hypothetical protein